MQHSAGTETREETASLYDKLLQFSKTEDNQKCADCFCTGEPMRRTWVSTNLGIFLCINCAGVHRSLGTHLSSILSLDLDEWNDSTVLEHILHIGNKVANECWLTPNTSLRHIDVSELHRAQMRGYILSKYNGKEFTPRQLSNRTIKNSKLVCTGASRVSAGILRIQLASGLELGKPGHAPPSTFAVFKIGTQQMKSKTCKRTATPMWKENWMVNVPENVSCIDVECWNSAFMSRNELLGTTKVHLDCIKGGEEHFMVLKFECGELHCLFQFNEL